jgi:hypothetical protein
VKHTRDQTLQLAEDRGFESRQDERFFDFIHYIAVLRSLIRIIIIMCIWDKYNHKKLFSYIDEHYFIVSHTLKQNR